MSLLQSVTAVTIVAAFFFGMVLALLGSIKIPLSKRLGLTEAKVGGMLAGLYLAIIPMMLISGVMLDRYGGKVLMTFGSVVAAAGLVGLALSERYQAAWGCILAVGAGGSCLSSGSSALMSRAFWPDSEAASQNLGNVFFGVGALLAPILAEWLTRRLDLRRALLALAGIGLIPGILALLTSGEAFAFQKQEGALGAVMRDPFLWITALAFFLYAPLEGTLSTWATTYLTELETPERRAALTLSGFWLTFLAARLGTALLLYWESVQQAMAGNEPWLLLMLALLAALFLGNMAGARKASTGVMAVLLIGAFFGPVFPTLVGILYGHFPEQKGTSFGAMFALGGLGNLLLPPVIGHYARHKTVRQAMWIPLVLALILAGVMLFLALARDLL